MAFSFWRSPFRGAIKAMRNAFASPIEKFDSKKAGQIYKNGYQPMYLSAGFIKPIVDFTVGFVGTPFVTKKDGTTNEVMDAFNNRKSSWMTSTRDAIVESMVYVRFDFQKSSPYSDKPEITVEILENERVLPLIDNRGYIIGYRVESDICYDSLDTSKSYRMEEYIYADRIEIKRFGAPLPLLKEETIQLRFGILTIVPIINEPDKNKVGMSDIEPLTPYLSLYHNIMEQANQYLHLHSEPKIKLKIADYNKFIELNSQIFNETEGTIDVGNGSVFFVQKDDDVAYISAASAMTDFTTLLQYTFYNIVQASQTPEFLMGVAIASSKASASEQSIILDVKTSRKRTMFHEQYLILFKVFSKIYSVVHTVQLGTDEVVLDWDNVQANSSDVSGGIAPVDGSSLPVIPSLKGVG
jgi:hypothetical protein